jgi:hypothetical protein
MRPEAMMFQVLATIFFSASVAVAFGVIAAMLADNGSDIREALGLRAAGMNRVPMRRPRRTVRIGVNMPQVMQSAPQRAAA